MKKMKNWQVPNLSWLRLAKGPWDSSNRWQTFLSATMDAIGGAIGGSEPFSVQSLEIISIMTISNRQVIDLLLRYSHPNKQLPVKNTHDPSPKRCAFWTWHHHILSVPLSPSSAKWQLQTPARAIVVPMCSHKILRGEMRRQMHHLAVPMPCQWAVDFWRSIIGKNHQQDETFTRETNHWFPFLICWYTLLTLCLISGKNHL